MVIHSSNQLLQMLFQVRLINDYIMTGSIGTQIWMLWFLVDKQRPCVLTSWFGSEIKCYLLISFCKDLTLLSNCWNLVKKMQRKLITLYGPDVKTDPI